MRWKGTWVSVDGGDFQQVGTPGEGAPLPPEAMQKLAAAMQQGKLAMEHLAGFDAELPGEIMRQAGFGDQAGFGGQAGYAAKSGFAANAPSGFRPSRWKVPLFWVFAFAIFMVSGLIAPFTSVLIPSSVLWTSRIVCRSGYHLADSSSKFSYKPNRGYSTSYLWCVSGDSSYHANEFAIVGLQFVLAGLVLCVALAVGVLIWRLSRKPR